MDSVVPAKRVDVLVFGAHPPDLRGLRNRLGERLDGAIGNLHVTGKTVGVGMAVAGASAAKRVFQLAPRVVVHLGTCGVYPGADYQPYDILVASKLVLVDQGVLAGRARWPEPVQVERDTHAMLSNGLAATPGQRVFRAPVACTLSITTDDRFATEIPRLTGCHAENLEGFAIAHACHLAEIPLVTVLAATHVVGSGAKEDWAKFERQATLAAGEHLVTWILNGAQGLPHDP